MLSSATSARRSLRSSSTRNRCRSGTIPRAKPFETCATIFGSSTTTVRITRWLLRSRSGTTSSESCCFSGPTWRQLTAGICLAVFTCAAVRSGFGDHLFFVAVPLGIVSMLLSYWRRRARAPHDRTLLPVVPFSSISEVLSVRHRVAQFSKSPYPRVLESRRIRGPVGEAVLWVPCILLWLMFSPLVLLFQSMPEDWSVPRVVLP